MAATVQQISILQRIEHIAEDWLQSERPESLNALMEEIREIVTDYNHKDVFNQVDTLEIQAVEGWEEKTKEHFANVIAGMVDLLAAYDATDAFSDLNA